MRALRDLACAVYVRITSWWKEDRYILVAGFTQTETHQFVRIRQAKEGSIYVEFAYRGNQQVPHYSYHATGLAHNINVDQFGRDRTENEQQLTPLAQFHDSYTMGTWVVTSHSFPLWRALAPTREERKAQALFCFDMSHFTGTFSITVDLLERERFDLLSLMMRQIPSSQVLVITTTNPWIVIRAWTQ
jgi:hypothetical protein